MSLERVRWGRAGVSKPVEVVARYDAVLFDLLTALLDSWSLWNAVAGGPEAGVLEGRVPAVDLRCGRLPAYEDLVAAAARNQGLDPHSLISSWPDGTSCGPGREAPWVLAELARG